MADEHEHDDLEQQLLTQSARAQQQVLGAINDLGGNPLGILHAMYELTGALSSAMMGHGGVRPEVTRGMAEALLARVIRDAGALPATSKRQH